MWISEIYNPDTHDTYREEVEKWKRKLKL
jgi:hypothetical protein